MNKITALLICLMAGAVNATPVIETGDAGALMGSGQILDAGTTSVSGTSWSGDVDLFSFGWGGGAFSAETSGSGDPQLFLFDNNGFGILADDDSAVGYNSLISTTLAAGNYFLAINGFNSEALSLTGNIFVDGCCGTELPMGAGAGNPLSGWSSTTGGAGNYTIAFNAATTAVPESVGMALLGLGLVGVRLTRKEKKS